MAFWSLGRKMTLSKPGVRAGGHLAEGPPAANLFAGRSARPFVATRSSRLLLALGTSLVLTGCGGGGSGSTQVPAGEIVVFQSNRDGQFELYIMNGDGTGQTRLTNNATLEQDPSWSRDARRIAFVSRLGAQSDSQEIFTANSDGSGSTRVTNNAFADDKPSFSPDGTRIVFRSTRQDTQNGQTFANSDIYIINTDGTNERRLTTNAGIDREPAFAPDGRILFAQETPGNVSGIFRICRINADGTGFTALTAGPEDARPSVSRDGSRIVYTARRDANSEIFTMNADGSNQTRLTTTAATERAPVFSPDGRRIVFGSLVGTNSDIYVMNSDGSNANNPVRLTTHIQTDTVPDVR